MIDWSDAVQIPLKRKYVVGKQFRQRKSTTSRGGTAYPRQMAKCDYCNKSFTFTPGPKGRGLICVRCY